ncbi:hypothetical protein PR003_g30787 [Phytophthora rubi]|uniref:Uncharacterized protein n=1 Tax=Phytophthora rubi TaxID=129364 RepID=A0A6A3H184_9STRA|nr:hypothetical protein PR001_g29574 [Phytophthora rubi]KAE9270531.1 hypothetical protein PR003_g30787 [Phytophthora rubi]
MYAEEVAAVESAEAAGDEFEQQEQASAEADVEIEAAEPVVEVLLCPLLLFGRSDRIY